MPTLIQMRLVRAVIVVSGLVIEATVLEGAASVRSVVGSTVAASMALVSLVEQRHVLSLGGGYLGGVSEEPVRCDDWGGQGSVVASAEASVASVTCLGVARSGGSG